ALAATCSIEAAVSVTDETTCSVDTAIEAACSALCFSDAVRSFALLTAASREVTCPVAPLTTSLAISVTELANFTTDSGFCRPSAMFSSSRFEARSLSLADIRVLLCVKNLFQPQDQDHPSTQISDPFQVIAA